MLPLMYLVIVESPTKAKKLRSYLPKEYNVEASIGHVRDLPKRVLGVEVDKNFEPTYEVSADKKKVIALLRSQAAKSEKVFLATDPDREGEAIAWHIQQLLEEGKEKRLKKGKKGTKATEKTGPTFVRSTFFEITKQAVLEAIDHPSQINSDLVDAQQARRVVDRLVGYEVSPVLWRKVRSGLSAGRVQSVALRLIVDREREIEAFKPDEYWEVDVALARTQLTGKSLNIFIDGKAKEELADGVLIARVVELAGKKYQPTTEAVVSPLRTWLPSANYTVVSLERKARRKSSLPPFTTSTLQQAAANRLGYTSKSTMRLAQQLYEEGLITYHRTDSVNLSPASVQMARDFIGTTYGKEYLPAKPRSFANTSKNAQEAHEAIRATEVGKVSVVGEAGLSDQHQKLYDLIRRRFLASQMSDAVYDQATLTIAADGTAKEKATLRTSGSVLKFDGWRKLFPTKEDVILPAVSEQQVLHFCQLNTAQKFTQPPARYNDASLVKELEKRGIGRPSTYASIISVIIDRGYVERQERRFLPTSIGLAVSDFLLANFRTFMEYDFTAEMEEDLDRIARGEKKWRTVVGIFYQPFHELVVKALDQAERVKLPVTETGESCPLCGKTEKGRLVIRTGKFGKFISCSRFPECTYTAKILEKFGDMKCPDCAEGDVIIKKSRWGKPFYGCSRYPDCKWASWKKPVLELGDAKEASAQAIQ